MFFVYRMISCVMWYGMLGLKFKLVPFECISVLRLFFPLIQ